MMRSSECLSLLPLPHYWPPLTTLPCEKALGGKGPIGWKNDEKPPRLNMQGGEILDAIVLLPVQITW